MVRQDWHWEGLGLAGGCLGLGLAWGLVGCGAGNSTVRLSSGRPDSFYHQLGEKITQVTQAEVGLNLEGLPSSGSTQNLTRLQAHQVDFALTQLDVAVAAMEKRQIKAVAVLSQEPIHVITTTTSGVRKLADLQNRQVGIGPPGGGPSYTAKVIFANQNIQVQADESPLDQALDKLTKNQLAAVVYVGSVGGNLTLRQWFKTQANLKLISMPPSLINYLSIREPDAYFPTRILQGSYSANPPIPPEDIATFSTSTVLATRADVSDQVVGLVTWAILDSAREFALFYPELQTGDATRLLQQGLFYVHPAASDVYKSGDPRSAWVRYWENNNDLQAGVMILVLSSVVGIVLQYWRYQRSQKVMAITTKRITELKQLLPDYPDQALQGIEELNQEQRLMFIDGKINAEAYDQAQHRAQRFSEQCQVLIQEKRNQAILKTLLLVDDWQATLQTRPEEALTKLKDLRLSYRQMLIENQVNIQDYIELMELTLMSLTTFAPTYVSEYPLMEPLTHLEGDSRPSQTPSAVMNEDR
ncbi:TAXI family TRAP transporter solute-binding subunit [Synechococcus sp. PCC 6312]|uniref:TAXI family TRAP transporter solute-binding subunit n=1 Tax=Synechococcus sp. (strain ATCC 27167 / PCC 6312) TaxID=195253 RepID=UPI00029F251E|nr:TAXI family TRAP transporter solute-binding subunit [Synechococcus sp. PCC 6312]AFY61486.1 TRAP transporter solute receptor, TAXI family [Synechococcus sp. PCC 6312]